MCEVSLCSACSDATADTQHHLTGPFIGSGHLTWAQVQFFSLAPLHRLRLTCLASPADWRARCRLCCRLSAGARWGRRGTSGRRSRWPQLGDGSCRPPGTRPAVTTAAAALCGTTAGHTRNIGTEKHGVLLQAASIVVLQNSSDGKICNTHGTAAKDRQW